MNEESFEKLLEESFDNPDAQEKLNSDEELSRIEDEEIKIRIQETQNKNMTIIKSLTKRKEKYKKLSRRNEKTLKVLSKKTKKEHPIDKSLCKDMNDFVRNYIGHVVNATRWRHCDLKSLEYPYVIGLSNDFARENIGYVKRGYILLVLDCGDNLAAYVNPKMLEEYVNGSEYGVTIIEAEIEERKKFRDFLVEIQKDRKVENLRQRVLVYRANYKLN